MPAVFFYYSIPTATAIAAAAKFSAINFYIKPPAFPLTRKAGDMFFKSPRA